MEKIVYIKTPQTILEGREGIFTNRRAYNPDPTLPLLESLTQEASNKYGLDIQVTNIDLRDDRYAGFEKKVIGNFSAPYLKRNLEKAIYGIDIEKSDEVRKIIEEADVVGFTSNFSANANSVAHYMKQIKKVNPKAEIWVGGSDASVKDRWDFYFSNGADIIFRGEVFDSLGRFLNYRFKGESEPINIVTKQGPSKYESGRCKDGSNYSTPLPNLPDLETLSKFSECAEGPYPGDQKDFLPAVYTQFNKGCTGSCDFCTTWILRPGFKTFDYETLDKHLEEYKQKGVKTLIMMDDSFLNMLKLPEIPKAQAIRHINEVMKRINNKSFNVEFGNGLELKVLNEHWGDISKELFRNAFRAYIPLEDLAYLNGDSPVYEKLMDFDHELNLLSKIIEARKKGSSLRQLTFGMIVGKPSDAEEGLEKTKQRVRQIKQLFEGSDIEIAFTPYLYSLLPGTVDYKKYNESLSLFDINEHPETLCYSIASNQTKHIKDTKKIWEAWQDIMNLNPAQDYLENFRKSGEVTLAKVK